MWKFKNLQAALFLLVSLLLVSPSFAETTATFGDQNSSGTYRMVATNSGTNAADGLITFAFDTGIKFPYTTGSTTYTITAAQTGTTIVFNNGGGTASNGTTFLLPTAVVGMQYTIVADVAKWFYLDCQTTDVINFSTATAGQRISNSATAVAGDSITVFCATAGQWSVKSRIGTWAVGPGQ